MLATSSNLKHSRTKTDSQTCGWPVYNLCRTDTKLKKTQYSCLQGSHSPVMGYTQKQIFMVQCDDYYDKDINKVLGAHREETIINNCSYHLLSAKARVYTLCICYYSSFSHQSCGYRKGFIMC